MTNGNTFFGFNTPGSFGAQWPIQNGFTTPFGAGGYGCNPAGCGAGCGTGFFGGFSPVSYAGTGYTGGFNGYGCTTPVNAPYNTGATTPFNGWSPTGFNQGFGGYANSFNPIFYGGFNPNFSNFIPNYIPNSTPNFNAGYNPIGGTPWNFGNAFPATPWNFTNYGNGNGWNTNTWNGNAWNTGNANTGAWTGQAWNQGFNTPCISGANRFFSGQNAFPGSPNTTGNTFGYTGQFPAFGTGITPWNYGTPNSWLGAANCNTLNGFNTPTFGFNGAFNGYGNPFSGFNTPWNGGLTPALWNCDTTPFQGFTPGYGFQNTTPWSATINPGTINPGTINPINAGAFNPAFNNPTGYTNFFPFAAAPFNTPFGQTPGFFNGFNPIYNNTFGNGGFGSTGFGNYGFGNYGFGIPFNQAAYGGFHGFNPAPSTLNAINGSPIGQGFTNSPFAVPCNTPFSPIYGQNGQPFNTFNANYQGQPFQNAGYTQNIPSCDRTGNPLTNGTLGLNREAA